MSCIQNVLAFDLDEPNHAVLDDKTMTGQVLDIVSLIVLSRIGTQVDHAGIDGQAMRLNGSDDIARHSDGHSRIGGGLKFVVYQCLLACNHDFDEAVHVVCLCCGLFCVEYVEDLDILVSECELDEVLRVFLDEVFRDGIVLGHVLALGLRVSLRRAL